MTTEAPTGPALWVRLAPIAIFALLSLATFLVWRQQVTHQRRLLARHNEDVCTQAARRLEIRLESRLRVAEIFARRWATHEGRDFSRQRFDEFASVLVREFAAYHTLRLVQAGKPDWVVPRGKPSSWEQVPRRREFLDEVRRRRELLLSPPVTDEGGGQDLFAAVPLVRDQEFLGHLVVEFRMEPLVGEVFHGRVRSEFYVKVTDGTTSLVRFADDSASFEGQAIGANQRFAIRNRTWSLAMVPRPERLETTSWSASLSVPFLGLALTVALSLAAQLLARRMDLLRAARDRTLLEMARREEAQRALQASEARYHSVFDSASDGLVVLDESDRVVEANPAASAMHGWTPEEFIGRSYQEFIAPDHQYLYKEFKRQLDQFGSVRLDSVHVRKDGSTVDVEVRGAPFSFGGEPRILAILTDVSDRKLAVQRHAMLSRKVLVAQEEERARVSRELHDELGQVLTALHLELDWLAKRVGGSGVLAGAFRDATAMVEKAAEELRVICRGLRPPLLDDLGLEPAVRQLVEEWEDRMKIRADMQIQLNDERPVPPEVALSTYRILQESLHNVGRHAQAKEVSITLVEKDGELMLSVYDDGKGFELSGSQSVESVQGCGIAGMRERASLVNGTIDIRSERFQGTRVIFRVPQDGGATRGSHDQNPGGR